MIPIIVMQTIAANPMGSMTPVGNPQNLYHNTRFPVWGMGRIFSVMGPLSALSLLILPVPCHNWYVTELLKHMEPSGGCRKSSKTAEAASPGIRFPEAPPESTVCFWRHCFSSAFFRYFQRVIRRPKSAVVKFDLTGCLLLAQVFTAAFFRKLNYPAFF